MRKLSWVLLGTLGFHLFAARTQASDLSNLVRKAVEKSTLDQPGTRPFHLKAEYAPSFERDKESHRVGEIEIWWQSPTRWRRQVRSPEFRQTAIMDGSRRWEVNDGDYFPDWLRELAVAVVRPVPIPMDVLLNRVKSAEIRHLAGQTVINWDPSSASGDAQSNGRGYFALIDQTGLLLYTGGLGWSGLYHDFKDFHGRMIARTVACGYVEVTAKVGVLEDLGTVPPGFFDAGTPGADPQPISTAALNEAELRQKLLSIQPVEWPKLEDGPLEGTAAADVVLDRAGTVREMSPVIVTNPGIKDAAEEVFHTMRFQPVLRDGVPVQAIGRISIPFKTERPAGVERFDSAENYFERGRKASFLAASGTAPYVLSAEFEVGTNSGVSRGRYEDTWIGETQWRREAWLGSSHFVRSHSGEKYYVLAEGPDQKLLRLLMIILEPIPAADTMTESDWRIRRESVDGVQAILVSSGPNGPDGKPDPAKSRAYWFDGSGRLLRSFAMGVEIRPLSLEPFGSIPVARQIDVLKDGKLAMRVTVTKISSATSESAKDFKIKGHEWERAFTAETR